jgi:hypothetical protein
MRKRAPPTGARSRLKHALHSRTPAASAEAAYVVWLKGRSPREGGKQPPSIAGARASWTSENARNVPFVAAYAKGTFLARGGEGTFVSSPRSATRPSDPEIRPVGFASPRHRGFAFVAWQPLFTDGSIEQPGGPKQEEKRGRSPSGAGAPAARQNRHGRCQGSASRKIWCEARQRGGGVKLVPRTSQDDRARAERCGRIDERKNKGAAEATPFGVRAYEEEPPGLLEQSI